MGSRPNSYIGYGIAWEEGDHSEVEKNDDMYDLRDRLDEYGKSENVIWAHEETPCLFIAMGETYTSNDWDDVGVVNADKLNLTDEAKVEYDKTLREICVEFDLIYKQPEFHLLSYYG